MAATHRLLARLNQLCRARTLSTHSSHAQKKRALIPARRCAYLQKKRAPPLRGALFRKSEQLTPTPPIPFSSWQEPTPFQL